MWARKVDGTWVDDTPPGMFEDRGNWYDLRSRDAALLAYLGWQPVIDTPRPADTDTSTYDRSIAMVRRALTVVWTERPWTPDELAANAVTQFGEAVSRTDQTGAALLLGALTQDIGTGTDVWPATKSWKSLNAVKAADLVTVQDVARIIVWMIPALLRMVRAVRKVLRILLKITAEDPSDVFA